ncbi:MAG: hypothetical protein QXD03_01690 [Candidatus Anstonellales archaeon]
MTRKKALIRRAREIRSVLKNIDTYNKKKAFIDSIKIAKNPMSVYNILRGVPGISFESYPQGGDSLYHIDIVYYNGKEIMRFYT